MNRIRIVAAAAVLLAAAGTVAVVAFAAFDRHSDDLNYPSVTRVVVDDDRGDVQLVSSHIAAGVTVKRTTTTLFARATQSGYVRDGVLHLASRCDHALCTVDYRISAPAGVRLLVVDHR